VFDSSLRHQYRQRFIAIKIAVNLFSLVRLQAICRHVIQILHHLRPLPVRQILITYRVVPVLSLRANPAWSLPKYLTQSCQQPRLSRCLLGIPLVPIRVAPCVACWHAGLATCGTEIPVRHIPCRPTGCVLAFWLAWHRDSEGGKKFGSAPKPARQFAVKTVPALPKASCPKPTAPQMQDAGNCEPGMA
jgi:hypothetical protein